MRIAILEGEPVAIVRDEGYVKEFEGFAAAKNHHVVATAQEMELALLLSGGYPDGSYQAGPYLNQLPPAYWEEGLAAQEIKGPGNAKRAIELLEFQRVYEKKGVSIVYMVVNNGAITTILLGTLNICEGVIPDILWKMLNLRP